MKVLLALFGIFALVLAVAAAIIAVVLAPVLFSIYKLLTINKP